MDSQIITCMIIPKIAVKRGIQQEQTVPKSTAVLRTPRLKMNPGIVPHILSRTITFQISARPTVGLDETILHGWE